MIDLDAGGEIVCVGTPKEVKRCERSHTGKALLEYERALERPLTPTLSSQGRGTSVRTAHPNPLPSHPHSHGAREHNLKGVDVEIRAIVFHRHHRRLGVSQCRLHIVFAEGQRRHLESRTRANSCSRRRTSATATDAHGGDRAAHQSGWAQSTVATLTETYHFLRLLYVKLGTQFLPAIRGCCDSTGAPTRSSRGSCASAAASRSCWALLVVARKGYYTDLAKWAAGKGFKQLRVGRRAHTHRQGPRLGRFREHTIELPVATPRSARTESALRGKRSTARSSSARAFCTRGGAEGHAAQGGEGERRIGVFDARTAPGVARALDPLDPRLFSFNSRHGAGASVAPG